MIKILIATPCKSGFVSINYMMSLIHSLRILNESGIQAALHFDYGKSNIDMPRSIAASYMLACGDFTHLMFIDDDMAWQPELIALLVGLNLDVVGVPYRQKNSEVTYMMRCAEVFDQSTDNPALINIHDIGTGLLLIRKNVLEELRDKVEWVVDHITQNKVGMFFRHQVVQDLMTNPNGEKSYMGEDLYFCRLAREAGFRIWAYIDAETAHTGVISFKGNYADIAESVTAGKFRDSAQKAPLRLMGAIG